MTDLRVGDPTTLGPYRLVSRLGEGGMGSVFLAHDQSGRPVAVKMIRSDLADDLEFRRRFRGEVERARQVPPFCTAEVLDADPDHETPYLVVEYIDGPSLAAVLKERGPLTPSNLHALAIGMATALTAIHGAGVVHRDLKPNNVLLAPGSPKVIDFGIARWIDGATANTRPNQLMGTVPYMAPERFDGEPDASLGPAADIFAWAAVVVVAGTGRTPFAAETPSSVATRILTAEPDVGSLDGPLRDLVLRCLAKDPADRPTARDLLDELLSGKRRDLAAALERQPALRVAVEGAQAATDHQLAAPRSHVSSETTRFADAAPGHPAAAGPRPPRRRVGTFLAALLVLAVLGTVAGFVAGQFRADPPGVGNQSSGPGSGPVTAASLLPDGRHVATDTLANEREWKKRVDEAQTATCDFAGALVVTRRTTGSYRCPGSVTPVGDLAAFVDVRLLSTGACAGIWFRFDSTNGYLLHVCADTMSLTTHPADGQTRAEELRAWPGTLAADTVARIGVSAIGDTLTVYRDGRPVGTHTDDQFTRGRVVLGIVTAEGATKGPFSVSFANVEIYGTV